MKRILLVASLLLAATTWAQPTVLRLAGSTTVLGALQPHQRELEQTTGTKLEFTGTGTAAGLQTLAAGDADLAMLSSSLEEAAHRVSQKIGAPVSPSGFRADQIGEAHLVFIVNPRNPVRHLSADQLGAVLSGRIANWKDVGSADLAILVVTLANPSPLVTDSVLHGQPIAAKARAVPSALQIPSIVAANPNAIGIVSNVHARGQTSVLKTDTTVSEPLILVSRGAPSAAAQKFVAAARAVLSKTPDS